MSDSQISENRLTPEAKAIIRDFVWRTLAIPGVVLVALSTLAGFAFNSILESQKGVAYADASRTAFSELFSSARQVTELSQQVSKMTEEANRTVIQANELNETLQQNSVLLKSQENIEAVKRLIASDPGFVEGITNTHGIID